jgi:hypothetical protein
MGQSRSSSRFPLVVEHLLEVRDSPQRIHAVAVEAAAQVIVQAAARHLAARECDLIEGLAGLALGQNVHSGEQQVERRRRRKLRRPAEAPVLGIGPLEQVRRRAGDGLRAGGLAGLSLRSLPQ